MSTKIDWKKLKQAHGPATRVPLQIKALTAADGDERDEAYHTLNGTLYSAGAWFSASAPAATLLCDVIDGKTQGRDRALWLLADVVAGDHEHALAGALAGRAPSADGDATRAAVVRRGSTLYSALSAKTPALRSAAALVLAFLPELAPESLRKLRSALGKEEDAPVRASLALALGVLGAARKSGDDQSLLEGLRTSDGRGLVRGAAALALLLVDAGTKPTSVAADLRAWLAATPEPGTLPWGHDYVSPGAAVRTLLAVAEARGVEARDGITAVLMDTVASEASPAVVDTVAAALLTLGGFKERWDEEDIALPEELSEAQRHIAEAISRRDGIRGIGWGLAPSARDRRRSLGLAPAGPLEKRIQFADKKTTVSWPVWKVWVAAHKRKPSEDVMPAPVREQLSPVERLISLAEAALGAYRIGSSTEVFVREEALVPAVGEAGAAAADWASSFLDELVRIADLPGQGPIPEAPPGVHTAASAALLAVVRSGRALSPTWDPLLPVAPLLPAREILAALPTERREAVLFAMFDKSRDPADDFDLKFLVPILDLAPSRRLAEIALEKIVHRAARFGLEDRVVAQHLPVIRELAEREPAVQDALEATPGLTASPSAKKAHQTGKSSASRTKK
ncbi:hypothetical protein WMF04_24110 [Sorangium sp. So ce260]|uniref:hypothetical protein n=1 Tax=Sorangium sp. So ce260 TaxID=3133291 RepID=UPI003F5F0499